MPDNIYIILCQLLTRRHLLNTSPDMITFAIANKKMSRQLFSIPNSKCLLTIILICFQLASVAYGQDSLKKTTDSSSFNTPENTKVTDSSPTVVNIVPAAFPGGNKEWIWYLVHNLVVPEEMRGTTFSRSILVKFTVDEKGRLKNFEDPGKDILKKEAIKVVKASGKWIPAYSNSKPIASECVRTITFQWN